MLLLFLAGQSVLAVAGVRAESSAPAFPFPVAQATPFSKEKAVPDEIQALEQKIRRAYSNGRTQAALADLQQLVPWVEANLGRVHEYRARTYLLQGVILHAANRPQEALVPAMEAAAIYRELRKINPSYSSGLALALGRLGYLSIRLDRKPEASAVFSELLSLHREVARGNPDLARDLLLYMGDMAQAQLQKGDRQGALSSGRKVLALTQRALDQGSSDYGSHIRALLLCSVFLGGVGERSAALAAAREAAALFDRKMQAKIDENPDVLNQKREVKHALGIAFMGIAGFQDAVSPLEEAVHAAERLRSNHPEYFREKKLTPLMIISLGGLLQAYSLTGQDKNVELVIEKQAPLIPSLSLMDSTEARARVGYYVDLAEYRRVKGQYSESIAAARRAIREAQVSGLADSFPVYVGNSLRTMARSLVALGDRPAAYAAVKQAADLYRKESKTNVNYIIGLAESLATLYGICSGIRDCMINEDVVRELVAIEDSYFRKQISLLPLSHREALRGSLGDWWHIVFANVESRPEGELVKQAMLVRLNRQGLLQDIQRNQALLARQDGPWRPLVEQIRALTNQLSSIHLPEGDRQKLKVQKEQVEQQLYKQLPQLRPGFVEPMQVASALRAVAPQGALLEYQRYRAHDPSKPLDEAWGPLHYMALLMRPDGSLRAIPLGEAGPIDQAIAEAVTASATAGEAQLAAMERLRRVSRLVLDPLQAELAGVRELFVSPDGELHRVPFAALPAPGGGKKLFSEKVQLRLLTTGRDLIRLQQAARGGHSSVLMANPAFDAPARTTASGSPRGASRQQRSGSLRGARPWQALPGTAAEAQELAPLLQVSRPITGPQATAAVALRQKAPRIFHIATHGFFAPDGPSREDPLLRSGLVFAGANQPDANPADDGYLTASEATGMDLEGTELVTLSACETGLGDVRSGEGVYGLQRALQVAGSRSMLLSLWKVPDALTARFMASFYTRLRRGEGRAEALQNTQQEFRSSEESVLNDVYVWGAFQLTGDWRPLGR